MKTVYETTDSYPFLDANARALLQGARDAYSACELHRMSMVEYDSNVALFCWAGDRALDTLLVQLRDRDLPVERDGTALVVKRHERG